MVSKQERHSKFVVVLKVTDIYFDGVAEPFDCKNTRYFFPLFPLVLCFFPSSNQVVGGEWVHYNYIRSIICFRRKLSLRLLLTCYNREYDVWGFIGWHYMFERKYFQLVDRKCVYFLLIRSLAPKNPSYACIMTSKRLGNDVITVHLKTSSLAILDFGINQANIYLIKVNNRKTRKGCEICSKLTKKMSKRGHSGVFIVNLEHVSHPFLVFLLLTLNIWETFFVG